MPFPRVGEFGSVELSLSLSLFGPLLSNIRALDREVFTSWFNLDDLRRPLERGSGGLLGELLVRGVILFKFFNLVGVTVF